MFSFSFCFLVLVVFLSCFSAFVLFRRGGEKTQGNIGNKLKKNKKQKNKKMFSSSSGAVAGASPAEANPSMAQIKRQPKRNDMCWHDNHTYAMAFTHKESLRRTSFTASR